ncbi:MAG: divergent polysaccharide deacetylase family protein [Candidatus Acidiferrales bacterium]
MGSRGRSIPLQETHRQINLGNSQFLFPCALRSCIAVCAIFVLSLIGCGGKPLNKADLRAITGEIVAAAQKATQHKSEITIRPQIQPSASGAGNLAGDDIYVTLNDASQAGALTQALDAIARRHKLTMAEARSGGVVRFDFLSSGTRTHTVHVVMPVAARPRSPAKPDSGAGPRLAIILDDMGYDRAAADAAFTLQFPITVSVIPHLPLSEEVAEEAYRRGDQVLLHLPMEAEADGAKPEPIELRVGMKPEQVEQELAAMLETVPHAAGVNNHQGSRATADPALMAELMPALRQRGLFFIDSRTTAATVAFDAAERAGVRSASRKVFLDDTPDRAAILSQLDLAARDAARDGFAIAIGHPHPATIAALADGIPPIEERGVRLVFASDVVR